MDIFSEATKNKFNKIIIDSFGTYIRGLLITTAVFVLGGLAGAFVVANSIDPRVSAVEQKQANLTEDFNVAYLQVSNRLRELEDSKIETGIQVQMLILYQIPPAEREKLRLEAEAKLDALKED